MFYINKLFLTVTQGRRSFPTSHSEETKACKALKRAQSPRQRVAESAPAPRLLAEFVLLTARLLMGRPDLRGRVGFRPSEWWPPPDERLPRARPRAMASMQMTGLAQRGEGVAKAASGIPASKVCTRTTPPAGSRSPAETPAPGKPKLGTWRGSKGLVMPLRALQPLQALLWPQTPGACGGSFCQCLPPKMQSLAGGSG